MHGQPHIKFKEIVIYTGWFKKMDSIIVIQSVGGTQMNAYVILVKCEWRSKMSYSKKNLFNATLFTTNPTWMYLKLSMGLHGEQPTTNLSYGHGPLFSNYLACALRYKHTWDVFWLLLIGCELKPLFLMECIYKFVEFILRNFVLT